MPASGAPSFRDAIIGINRSEGCHLRRKWGSTLKPKYRTFAFAVAGILFAILLLGCGFFLGSRKSSYGDPSPPSDRSSRPARHDRPAPPAPAALPSMIKASALRDQNRFAYEAKYLNKPYRVTGVIDSIVGPFLPDGQGLDWSIRSESGFEVILEPWDDLHLNPTASAPHLKLSDLSAKEQLSLRPLQNIDATCVLKGWMDFRNCHSNIPIPSNIPPDRKSWWCKRNPLMREGCERPIK